MAPELKSNKRKGMGLILDSLVRLLILAQNTGASEPSVVTKKQKKADLQPEIVAPRKASKKTKGGVALKKDDAPVPKPAKKPRDEVALQKDDAPVPKPLKTSRKRAADFFDAEDAGTEVVSGVAPGKLKKTKTSKAARDAEPEVQATTDKAGKKKTVKAADKPIEGLVVAEKEGKVRKSNGSNTFKAAVGPTEEAAVEKVGKTKTTRGKKPKAACEPIEESAAVEDTVAPTEEDDDGPEDDQTAALLKGFESSSEEDISEGEGIILDQIPTLPDDKTLRKKLAGVAKTGSEQPGVIYVGYDSPFHPPEPYPKLIHHSRVPHGFYEHQMRAYFSQFGDIRRLRLSRNRKTGHSKHYAFIEFASSDVAQIVADTMNKYLMFGHILQVRTIPTAQVLEHLFKGANSRFKPVPRNKIEARKLRLGTDREGWEKRSEREKKRRESKAEKLKALGYEYEAPSLRSAKDVLTKGADENGAAQVEAAKEEEVVQALPEPATQEPATETRSLTVVQTEPHSVTVTEQVTIKKAKKDAGKVKKGKKTKTAAA
ncbi:hypothetical protein LTR04_003471 [Oleoguttula sp. CCFEE 6159]|nr:hypothetical protein LTR04_003471 [Oleoguttula sp. CCFEE 6159]